MSALRDNTDHWDVNLGLWFGGCDANLEHSLGAFVFRALDFLWPAAEAPSLKWQAGCLLTLNWHYQALELYSLTEGPRAGLEMTGPQS